MSNLLCRIVVLSLAVGLVSCTKHRDEEPQPPVTSVEPTVEVPRTGSVTNTHRRTSTTIVEGQATTDRQTTTAGGAKFHETGEKVEAPGTLFTNPTVGLTDTGVADGGSLSGDFKAMVSSSQLLIRVCALLISLGLAGLAVLTFKRTPLDWHYWSGLALGSVAAFVVFIQPELFWVGLGGLGVCALINFWPSLSAMIHRSAMAEMMEFVKADPQRQAAWDKWQTDHVEAKDRPAIDQAAKDSI